MKKIDLGQPTTKERTREGPADYVKRLRETYKHVPNAPLDLLITWDRQEIKAKKESEKNDRPA